MHSEIKDKAPIIRQKIEESNKILCHLHPDYDPDSIGSALAMKHVISQVNSNASVDVILGDNKEKKALTFLPGSKDILQKGFSEIVINDYDLFIVLDSSSPNQITDLNTPVFPLAIPTIVIDHHKNNSSYGDINLVLENVIATSEILYWLFKEWGVTINKDIATCLFAGIWGDSGGFMYDGTSELTLLTASELKRTGIDTAKMVYLMGSLKNIQLLAIGKILSSITEYYSGLLVMVRVSLDELISIGLTEEDFDQVMANVNPMLSRSNDAIVTVSLKEKSRGEISVSFRNNNLDPAKQCDVSVIAVELGGGGHKRAAGVRTKGLTFDEAEQLVLEKVKEIYPEIFR